MLNLEKNKKNLLFIVSSIFILIGASILIYNFYKEKEIEIIENDSINYFFEEEVEEVITDEIIEIKEENKIVYNYEMVLEIPKINLYKGLFSIDSKYNNVNKNIEILDGSVLPNENNYTTILAGHSGNGTTAYFMYLYKVNNGNLINLYYDDIKYVYEIIDIYEIDKTGYMGIDRNNKYLYLLTCKSGTEKQIVVKAIEVSQESYKEA